MRRDERFLETASRLGARLCRDAVWDGRRCNWLGDSVEFHEGRWQVVHRSFGPALYDGTSGIALFLARLHQLTGEKPYRTAAEGAMGQALSQLERVPPGSRGSFYCGWTGIAWCLAQLAEVLEAPRFLEPASGLLDRLLGEGLEAQGLDVVAGSAGAIAPLLALRGLPSGGKAMDLAAAQGERLLTAACRSEAGWSWDVGIPALQPLTGLAHGASGFGWALLELYAATGEARFRQGAEEALRYERHCFDAMRENWPDFRIQDASQTEPSFGVAWCYGAGGIGLTRLRAYQVLGEAVWRAEAEAALRTTRAWLRDVWQTGAGNFSLCHGIGGNAEVLILASELLGLAECREEAESWGVRGVEWYEEPGHSWPCGVPGGEETPTLMLGLAGIGYFYLRLFDPVRVPSVLLCAPDGVPALSNRGICAAATDSA